MLYKQYFFNLICIVISCVIPMCRYIKLAARHPESNTAGMDIFAKFSAYIKNSKPDTNEGMLYGHSHTYVRDVLKVAMHKTEEPWPQLIDCHKGVTQKLPDKIVDVRSVSPPGWYIAWNCFLEISS